MNPFPVVPAHGEVLVWMWPNDDAEPDDDEPYFLNRCPIVAWRVVTQDGETWGEPVLPRQAELPERPNGGLMTGILMPGGQVFSTDGDAWHDSVAAFEARWKKFYIYLRNRRTGVGRTADPQEDPA